MEKNNIFDGACFGKPYRTRDGRKAIYTMMSCGSHWLVIQDSSFTWEYDNQGKLVSNIDNGMDIISEWKEEINDEELRKEIEEYAENMMIIHCKEHHIDCPNHIIKDALRRAYEDGHRKEKQE